MRHALRVKTSGSPPFFGVTVTVTNLERPAKSFIDPAGSVTSPEGERQVLSMPSAYDGRCDQISSGPPSAMIRSPKSVQVLWR